MKFTLFFVLSCLSFCFANSMIVTTWGNVNSRTLGTENVFVEWSFLRVKEYNLTYPKVKLIHSSIYCKNILIFFSTLIFQQPSKFPIVGIRHLDYESKPVKVNFLQGGIGYNNVKLHITSQRNNGINSTFVFYTI